MARSLEAIRRAQLGAIALPDAQEVLDLLDRDRAPFDPSYGDTLPELLPRRLGDLVTRH
jgi:hypothetical protein